MGENDHLSLPNKVPEINKQNTIFFFLMFTVHLHKNTEQAGNSYNNQQGQASHQ
jgi:hypothetical protein